MKKKEKISVYKDPSKGIYGDYGATIDIGDNQIQVISPSKSQRDKMIAMVKSAYKSLA